MDFTPNTFSLAIAIIFIIISIKVAIDEINIDE